MSTPTTPTASLWRRPEFLKFWAGQSVSVFGSAITQLALPLTAVNLLNATPAQMGLLNAAQMLPFLLVALLAGAWVDRRRRRPIMLLADIGRAVCLALIPLSLWLGWLRMEVLYALVFGIGVLTVIFDVAYYAFLPTLVRREHLVEGNSKLEVSNSVAEIGAPGLAGWLVQVFTGPVALLIDAASFAVSAVMLAWVRINEPEPQPRVAGTPDLIKEIREGLGVVLGNRMLWSIAGCTATLNFFNNIWGSLYVLYMTRNLQLSAAQIGLVFAMGAPGALAASLVAARIARRLGLGPTIIGAALGFGLANLLVLFVRGSLEGVIAILVVRGFCVGFCNTVYNVNQVSLRQAVTPDRLLGRMSASMRFMVWGTIPLGALASSGLSSILGVVPTLTVGLFGALLGWLWVFFSPVRGLRAQPEPDRRATE